MARVGLLRVGVGAGALRGVLVVGHRGVLVVTDVRALALADQAPRLVKVTSVCNVIMCHPNFQSS